MNAAAALLASGASASSSAAGYRTTVGRVVARPFVSTTTTMRQTAYGARWGPSHHALVHSLPPSTMGPSPPYGSRCRRCLLSSSTSSSMINSIPRRRSSVVAAASSSSTLNYPSLSSSASIRSYMSPTAGSRPALVPCSSQYTAGESTIYWQSRRAFTSSASPFVEHLPRGSSSNRELSSTAIAARGDTEGGTAGTATVDSKSFSSSRLRSNDEISSTNNVLLNVSAVHVAQTIDLYPCLSDLMAKYTFRKQASHKNSVLIELSPNEQQGGSSSGQSTTTTTTATGAAATSTSNYPRYVAMYRFGSLVFVNCPPHMVAEFSHFVKRRHAVQPVPNGLERRESYGILLQPPSTVLPPSSSELDSVMAAAATDSQSPSASSSPAARARWGSSMPLSLSPPSTTGDYCVLNELDMNAISVVSNVMAQTVALDTYNDMVDDLLAKFAKINHKVTQTGWVPDSERAFLFKTIAQNHIIFNDMISKLRIKDRSDTAWNLTRYESTWYGMRDEFEMDERFENMEFKLKLIEQNAKFFVEALQSQKSNTLEWIIVVLIAVECVIMTADMTGMGEALLSPLLEQFKGWWWAAAPDGVDPGAGTSADVLASSSSASSISPLDTDPSMTAAASPDSSASSTNQSGNR